MRRLFTAALTGAMMFATVPAHAASFDTGSVYGTLGVGAAMPNNTDDEVTGAITGSGKIHYKTGAAFTGTVGYHFNQFFAGEAEIGYSRVKYDRLSGTLTAGALGAGSGDIDIDGHASAFTGLLNGVVTPFQGLGFSPYVGGGLGFASTHSKINTETFQGTTFAVNSSESNTDFAADALVGFDVPVGQGFSLGARYQYLWINSGDTTTNSGVTEKVGNFSANVVTARATFKF